MYESLLEELENQLSLKELDDIKKRSLHLGIFSEPYLTYMLNGSKTVESRFSKNKIMPYNQISKNDIVFVKKSSGNILAYFSIKEVLFFDLKETSITEIRKKYEAALCVDEIFWQNKSKSNYATLIVIDKLVKLKPIHINKKGMQTWIKLKDN